VFDKLERMKQYGFDFITTAFNHEWTGANQKGNKIIIIIIFLL
jgi:hypothetical protein